MLQQYCRQIAAVGDEMDVKISGWNKEQDEISGSIRAIHPENDPWEGNWSLKAGDVYEGRILRWVENADRCGGAGGYLVEIKPARWSCSAATTRVNLRLATSVVLPSRWSTIASDMSPCNWFAELISCQKGPP